MQTFSIAKEEVEGETVGIASFYGEAISLGMKHLSF